MAPPLGHTRCYWALLSPSLQFLYLDPVFQAHLTDPSSDNIKPSPTAKSTSDVLIGKSLLDLVHPEEQNSAKIDLGTVLDSRILHGSVTRVRFSSLNRTRKEVGCKPRDDAAKVGADKDYLPVDVVINWAADGIVLCFLHAVVDIDPEKENDFSRRATQPWTNWCGTPELGADQVQVMYSRLLVCGAAETNGARAGPPGADGPSGERVFQILANDETKTNLISWPPVDHGPLARLAHNIDLDAVNTDAKTSCTRRFKASNFIPEVGHVESIFIPHGSIIFACHKVVPPNLMSPSSYDYYLPPNSHSYSYQPGPPPASWSRSGNTYYDPSAPPAPPPPNAYVDYDNYHPPPPTDEVPPPRRKASPTQQSPSGSAGGSSGRGNRPAGILKCSSCKATASPEWRKGPSGRKELCNACGLRYARSRAKKDGTTKSGKGGKARSSTSVAVMKREGSVASSTGGSKTDGGGGSGGGGPSPDGVFDGPSTYQQGPPPGYDYYRGRDDDSGRFTEGGPRGDHRFKAAPPAYDRPPYAAAPRAYPAAEGESYYHHTSPLASASYERRRD